MLMTLGVLSMIFVVAFTLYNYRSGADVAGRREALVEAWTQLIIGFTINFGANLLLIPMMSEGGRVSASNNFFGGWVYTAVSLVRQYAVRRWFSRHLQSVQRWVLHTWSKHVK